MPHNVSQSGKITANITGGEAPFNIVVRKEGELVGNRCTSGCNQFPSFFNVDDVAANYYFILNDANNCIIDSRTLPNGIGALDCTIALTPPSFLAKVHQPYCGENNAGLQNAQIIFENVSNATYYKICDGSNFNCTDGCSNPSGTINGSTFTVSLNVLSNQTKDYIIRVYNGCNSFKDILVRLYAQDCNNNNFISLYVINFLLFQSKQFSDNTNIFCDQPNTYRLTGNFYVKDTTVGSTTFNQEAKSFLLAEKNIPNNEITPNIKVAGPLKPTCGANALSNETINSLFYRFNFNFLQIIADNPSINTFTFDVHMKITKKMSDLKYPNLIRVSENKFNGVSMIYELSANDSVDAGRNPLYPQIGGIKETDIYKTQSVNDPYILLGTILYNKTANTCDFNIV